MTPFLLVVLLAHQGAREPFEKREHKAADGSTLSFLLLEPERIKAGAKFPLVVCLHGRGGNSMAATTLARKEMRGRHAAFVMAPSIDGSTHRWAKPPGAADDTTEVHRTVMEAVDALIKELPIDPDRLYVTGQSMGGYGTFGFLANHADRFAAAAPVCGGWDPDDAKKFAKVPIWIFHGADDPTVPVAQSRRTAEALKEAGGEPKFTEYPGVGHNSWEKAYAEKEFWTWLFAQKRAPK